jgi:hypothetical protein
MPPGPETAPAHLALAATALVFAADPALAQPANTRLRASAIQWDQTPTPDQLMSLYPARAQQAHLAARSEMSCKLTPDGTLDHCAINAEAPSGYGLGYASIQAAHFFRAHMTDALRSAVGAGDVSVTIPFTWPPAAE